MKRVIRLRVNGVDKEVLVEPWWMLADVLHDELGLAVRTACDRGDCGSCTILLDGKAVKSCLILAPKAEGQEITTIEGLRSNNGELHPLQQAFVDYFAIQCGYCTPGMILAAKALLDENPGPTEEEVREAIRGNICRCTGYKKIVEAILATKHKTKARI